MDLPTPVIVHAFADGDRGGNPAAVVLDADAIDAPTRQRIAAQAGVPETAFVSRSAVATLRLEFYTPNRQIAHCGHATVATFGLLHLLGRLAEGEYSKETIDGVRAVRIEAGRVFLAQVPRAIHVDRVAREDMAHMLSLPVDALVDGPDYVDTGNAFVHVAVRDAETLAAARPDPAAIAQLSEHLDLIGIYAHTRNGVAEGRLASARMFAPRYGIPEESATGTAASGLAWWLALRGELGERGSIEQGRWMHPPAVSPIELRVEREGDAITRLWVGGAIRRGQAAAD